jgi:hypothetical protein
MTVEHGKFAAVSRQRAVQQSTNEASPPENPMITQEPQDEHADIRDAVAKLCAQFPGEYWRKLDREMA